MSIYDAKLKAIEICEKLYLSQYLKKFPINLPYSIQRLVMFARAIVHNPEILLLDEPTLNLDPISREMIWDFIYSINKSKTIFYTTQNFKEAQEHSDRIAILYDGVIKYNGTFDYLVKNTYGLARFSITFNDKIPESIKKSISINPKIIKPIVLENIIKFYSTDKLEFFKILKDSINNDIIDLDSSKCTLEDIFKGIDEGEK